MNVTQAVLARRSTRDFLPDPVPHELVREVLQLSARAPSGGNLQPWHLDVVAGTALNDLRRHVRALLADVTSAQYPVYPTNLGEPYRTYRYQVARRSTDGSASAPRTRRVDAPGSRATTTALTRR
jgi:nitroreductase